MSDLNGRHRPAVSVVVLSYNRPGLLREALQSVAVQSLHPAEVIVVDNRSSRSAEVARVVASFRGFRLLANAANLGFTGGMNAGLRAATAEYVYLTEDDITLAPDYLEILVRFLSARPDVGLATGVQLNRSDRTVRFAGGRFSLAARYRFDLPGQNQPLSPDLRQPFPTAFAPGSMLLARSEVWRMLTGFREDFFMYFEDAELCARARRKGLEVMVVPAAVATHADPQPDARLPAEFEARKVANFASLYLLHAATRVLPSFFLRYAVLGPVRALLRDRREFAIQARGWAAFAGRLPRLLRDRRRLGHVCRATTVPGTAACPLRSAPQGAQAAG
jgi:GT2 family glycosyltransferase